MAELRAASVSGLAERLGMSIATAHRILTELERLGYLRRLPGTRQWTVAHRLVGVAADVLTTAAGSVRLNTILRSLSEEVGEVSSFAVQSADEVLYVASIESAHELTLSFRTGRTAPLFCTSSGRIFLARLGDQDVLEYLQSAPRPAFTPHRDGSDKAPQHCSARSPPRLRRHLSGICPPCLRRGRAHP